MSLAAPEPGEGVTLPTGHEEKETQAVVDSTAGGQGDWSLLESAFRDGRSPRSRVQTSTSNATNETIEKELASTGDLELITDQSPRNKSSVIRANRQKSLLPSFGARACLRWMVNTNSFEIVFASLILMTQNELGDVYVYLRRLLRERPVL